MLTIYVVVCCGGYTLAADVTEPAGFVERVADSDAGIRTWEAHVVLTLDAGPLAELDWGYDAGMQFMSGKCYVRFPGEKTLRTSDETWTFDGEKMRGLRDQHAASRPLVGVVRGYQPESFRGTFSPATLLGGDLQYGGILRFGEALRSCKIVVLRDAPEHVNGRTCKVLELAEADKLPDGRVFDSLVWIAPDLDYRVVRYDKYVSYGGKLRWQVLQQRVDVTKFERIGGQCFPIFGTIQCIGSEFAPVSGFTKDDCRNLTPEQIEQKGLKVVRRSVNTYVVDVSPQSVKVNQEIPKEKFTIVFPAGCLVTDEFIGQNYRVGN